jgi:hypothetical protein
MGKKIIQQHFVDEDNQHVDLYLVSRTDTTVSYYIYEFGKLNPKVTEAFENQNNGTVIIGDFYISELVFNQIEMEDEVCV